MARAQIGRLLAEVTVRGPRQQAWSPEPKANLRTLSSEATGIGKHQTLGNNWQLYPTFSGSRVTSQQGTKPFPPV